MNQFIPSLISWLSVAAWAGLIFFLSSIPGLSTGWGIWDLVLRKIAHLTEYGILTFLLIRAFVKSCPAMVRARIVVWCGLLSVAYAISDEFHQSFVPGRGPSAGDVVIDACGVAICLLIFYRGSARALFGVPPR